ncbi:hypothetical protein RHA06_004476, partial [Escherichia coli]|nr:hypothetical protein [Escherichia coli]
HHRPRYPAHAGEPGHAESPAYSQSLEQWNTAKAGAVLIFWHELAINGYTSMNAIKRQEIIDADHQRLRKLIWPEDDWK